MDYVAKIKELKRELSSTTDVNLKSDLENEIKMLFDKMNELVYVITTRQQVKDSTTFNVNVFRTREDADIEIQNLYSLWLQNCKDMGWNVFNNFCVDGSAYIVEDNGNSISWGISEIYLK